ncbi:hypothetical protein JXM67_14075 [candidate division WOR-3 bacterium]|nr:hypothetical protein [candidate division WOR-3 bacterium]
MEEQTTPTVPSENPASDSRISEIDVLQLNRAIKNTRGWAAFIGIILIILGCLAGVGCLVGGIILVFTKGIGTALLLFLGVVMTLIVIWLGALLNQSAKKASRYLKAPDEHQLIAYHSKLRHFFTLMGVVRILALALAVSVIALSLLGLVTGSFMGIMKF